MPAGRPLIEIDQKQFEQLCGIQCTQEEIASFFNCSADTIDRWCKRTYKKKFAEVFAEKRGKGKVSLRRAQFQMAETNPTMAIWLGKQYLGQKDNKDLNIKQTIEQEAIDAVEDFLNDDDEGETGPS